MNRLWTGVVASLLAATVLVGVGISAYNAGQDDDRVTRVVTEDTETGDGEVVRVIDDDDGWRRGPGFGFFLFPLLIIGGIVLLARGRRHHHGSWGHGYGWGPGGPGGPGRCGDPDERVREYHRRLHEDDERVTAPTSTPAPDAEARPPEEP